MGLRILEVDESTSISEIIDNFSHSNEDLLLIDSKSVVSLPHLELLTDYPRTVTSVLVAQDKSGNCFVSNGQVSAASSSFHTISRGNHYFVGLIRLSQNQREAILESAKQVLESTIKGDVLDLLLVSLVRNAVTVAAVPLASAPWIRSNDANVRQSQAQKIENLNPNTLRLKLANRSNDGFYSVWFLRKISKLLTWVAVRIGISPNQITIASLFIGLYAAYMFAQGTKSGLIIGAVAMQLSIIVDCVDGEIARYTRKFSNLGAWLDAVTDRVKEYIVFFGLAYGANQNGVNLWNIAMGMMVFQTFRHISDYNFAAISKQRRPALEELDFNISNDSRMSEERESKGSLRYWLGKVLNLPIGERWLLISLSAAIGGAQFTFIALPLAALISIAIVFRRRIRAMQNWNESDFGKELISSQLDLWKVKSGVLKKFNWLEPSLLRLVELLVLIAMFTASDQSSEIEFLLLFAIVFHHYDGMYRALQGAAKPKWLSILGLYIGFRTLLIGVFIFAGISLAYLTGYFLLLFLFVSSIQWIRKLIK